MSDENIGTLVGKIYDLVKNLGQDDIAKVFAAVSALFGGSAGVQILPPENPNDPARSSQGSGIQAPKQRSNNIRSFIEEKNPKNDIQLAATIAYYYTFEAPDDQKKDAINSTDLTDAIRLANRKRPPRPSQVLTNAKNMGLLDNAGDRGHFRINSVGENLVAMVLPGDGTGKSKAIKKRATRMNSKSKRPRRRK